MKARRAAAAAAVGFALSLTVLSGPVAADPSGEPAVDSTTEPATDSPSDVPGTPDVKPSPTPTTPDVDPTTAAPTSTAATHPASSGPATRPTTHRPTARPTTHRPTVRPTPTRRPSPHHSSRRPSPVTSPSRTRVIWPQLGPTSARAAPGGEVQSTPAERPPGTTPGGSSSAGVAGPPSVGASAHLGARRRQPLWPYLLVVGSFTVLVMVIFTFVWLLVERHHARRPFTGDDPSLWDRR